MSRYSEQEARGAVAASLSFAETLRLLTLCPTGGNWRTPRLWVERWEISTEHFDPDAARRDALRSTPRPLEEILVEHSSYSRNHLKVGCTSPASRRRSASCVARTRRGGAGGWV